MRAKHLFVTGCVITLAFLAPFTPAGDAPKTVPERNLDALATKLVNQCAGVREGELIGITGDPKDAEILEDLAVQVRKRGAHPLIMLTSDRLSRRLYDDVPAQFDSQAPKWDVKLAELLDAQFVLESGDEAALAHVPAARVAVREKTFQPVFKRMRERNVRIIFLGNGLYPTSSRAEQFGLSKAELAKLFWDGVNTDYLQLQATGAKVKKVLSQGKEIHLTHANGTNLKASIEKRPVLVSDGVIDEAKRKQGGAACWTYLPAGEVYASTATGTAEGRVVVDRVFFEGKEINDLIMEVKDGKVVSLAAKANGDRLQAAFKAAAEGKDRFGVIDIGINPDVRPPTNSKVLAATPAGMISVYVGNDTWAGGDDNTPFSLTGYLPGGTLTVDDKAIVEKGELKP
jgi:leucyl aminopeptidase (aminopeptidase T)